MPLKSTERRIGEVRSNPDLLLEVFFEQARESINRRDRAIALLDEAIDIAGVECDPAVVSAVRKALLQLELL